MPPLDVDRDYGGLAGASAPSATSATSASRRSW